MRTVSLAALRSLASFHRQWHAVAQYHATYTWRFEGTGIPTCPRDSDSCDWEIVWLLGHFPGKSTKTKTRKELGLSEITNKIRICTDSCSNHTGAAMCADSLRFVLIHCDVCWFTAICADSLRCVLIHYNMCRFYAMCITPTKSPHSGFSRYNSRPNTDYSICSILFVCRSLHAHIRTPP